MVKDALKMVVWRRGRTPNTHLTYCFIDIFLLIKNSTPHFTPQILLKNVVFKSGVFSFEGY